MVDVWLGFENSPLTARHTSLRMFSHNRRGDGGNIDDDERLSDAETCRSVAEDEV